MAAEASGGTTGRDHHVRAVVLLFLAGVGLRITVLAVPPVIPLLHADLGLTQTGLGILSGLPSLMFAWAAVPGSLLIARLGARPTLVLGLTATALASALRGAASEVVLLDAATLAMGLGIAVMQPSLPPLVRAWLPRGIGFGTAVYTSGLLIGEVLVVWLTIPLVLPALQGSWRLGFVAWSVPVALTALLVLLLAPGAAAPAGTLAAPLRRWWPDWRSSLLWRLGFIFGSVNTIYFATNAFLPDYLTHAGRADLIGDALTALNLGQVPAALLLLAVAGRLARRKAAYVASALLTLLGLVAMVATDVTAVIISGAALVGFANAVTLTLGLALPALLVPAEDVPRTSAGMFTISYHCAVAVPIVGGLAWDATGTPYVAFALIALGAFVIMILASSLDLRSGAG